jgi:hypothetical protein
MRTSTLKVLAVAAVCSLLVVGAQAQTVIFFENFDPLTPPHAVQNGYQFGDTTSSSSAVVAGVGVSGTAGWETVNTAASGANGYSGVGGQYQDGNATGNTSLNKGDYTLEFDGRSTGGSLHIDVQTWDGAGFGGSANGSLSTTSDITFTSTYAHYILNLGSFSGTLTGLGLTGGTIQLNMQFNAGGPTPYSNTLDIDNLKLTMVPEPSSFALCALGGLALTVYRRRKA